MRVGDVFLLGTFGVAAALFVLWSGREGFFGDAVPPPVVTPAPVARTQPARTPPVVPVAEPVKTPVPPIAPPATATDATAANAAAIRARRERSRARWSSRLIPWWCYRDGYPPFKGFLAPGTGVLLPHDTAGGGGSVFTHEPMEDVAHAAAEVMAASATGDGTGAEVKPVFAHQQTRSVWDWNVSTESMHSREQGSSTLATLTPVTFTISRVIAPRGWRVFRPTVTAGTGVLRHTLEGRDVGDEGMKQELLPLVRAGLGAEWNWNDNVIFKLNYDYTRLPVESSLVPSMPERQHSINLGVELRF
jgi:hypothetical protein